MAGGDDDASSSPKSRLKFLCSYGGKILPRPSDGMLKYVGGETRVVSAPRSITFAELKEKISGMFNNSDTVIKYQVMPEDLDVLVSVRSDQDLQHMLEEYDRHESLPRSPSSSTRFRVFLFPSTTLPATPRSPSYVAAINAGGNIAFSASNRPIFSISTPSSCTSPPSTVDYSTSGGRPSGLGMHRVRSSPNLGGSSSQLANNNTAGLPSLNRPRSRIGSSYRQEMWGYGGSRYYNSPSGGNTGGCGFRPGHMEELYRSRNGHNSFQFTGPPPPLAPRRSIWE